MKLLVTGGAGYIGSIVSRLLISEGHELVVFDSLERGHREAVAPQAQLIVGDLRNPDEIDQALSSCFISRRWRWSVNPSITRSATTARTSAEP
jgi:UDP-glucose 4-epimerase